MRWLILLGLIVLPFQALALEPIRVTKDGSGFEFTPSGKPFHPWGFNYDHDRAGRLIEDYWDADWKDVEGDFAEMRALGANVVRVHLQFGKFMKDPGTAELRTLAKLQELVALAERSELYLDLTGLACYHKADVPEWYDNLSEADRWAAQAEFWKAIARTVGRSPAVFCYDLMNEPVVPGGQRKDRDWLGPPFAGKHFVQVISLDQRGRPRPEIAKSWIHQMVAAIREVDQTHLITVGMVDWSLDRPGLTSGFVPDAVSTELDFLAVHLYPTRGKLADDLETFRAFQKVGKPVLLEETFPLKCSTTELAEFLDQARPNGVTGFYWGQTIEELTPPPDIGAGLTRSWLELFQSRSPLKAH